jgi:uncharacterized tellurite resistance protein B-like protein
MSMTEMSPEDRLRLMRFVCSFAWADLEVADSERGFVATMMRQLDLDEAERRQVDEWLKVPPRPEDVDPTDIPVEHRQLFLNSALQMVGADGVVDEREVETFSLFEKLLR